MALPLYALTLILSSSLLFFVQPMVGKMILPLLGGTPAVWNTCMVFFQACLLAGYAYAHGSAAWLGTRRQSVAHLALLLLPLVALPISFGADVSPPASGNPAMWLLARLAVCAGLPFFVVSASAPLLQKWFAQTGHPSAKDPYFLYAASNVGSLGALLGYPLLVEPNMNLATQTTAWSIGYGLLICAFICCGVALWRARPASPVEATIAEPRVCIGWPRRIHWILLAAVPSSLMLGVTTHVTTNVAAVPLLWVVPLAIYLLTFILVFAARPPIPHRLMVQMLPFVVIVLGLLFFAPPQELGWYVIPLHLLAFFVAAMVCHGELARRRPGTQHLTEYYLWMSFGGVLGGLFNAIVAPLVFHSIAEYPIAVVAACMLMPRGGSQHGAGPSRQAPHRLLDLCLPLGVGLIALAIVTGLKMADAPVTWLSLMAVFFIPAFLSFQFKDRPVRFGLALAVVLLVTASYSEAGSGDVLAIERNFFGVKKVMYSQDHRTRLLAHGTTNHGSQSIDPARADQPLAYFHRNGPLGDVFSSIAGRSPAPPVGIIGLGVGSIAAYAEPGQAFTYYEIDPAVEQLARNDAYFTFLSKCNGQVDVVLGDGRLTIARAPEKHFGLIILDAFSSDAIPTHLLSLEAMNVYLSRLADDGLLAFHISNGFLNLEPVVARLAHEAGLACISRSDRGMPRDQLAEGQLAAHYVVMARSPERLAALESMPRWHRCEPAKNVPVWTDQYCDILGVLRLPQPGTAPPHLAQSTPARDGTAAESPKRLKLK